MKAKPILTLIIITLALGACKDDSLDPAPTNPINQSKLRSYSYTLADFDNYYWLKYNDDGTLRIYDTKSYGLNIFEYENGRLAQIRNTSRSCDVYYGDDEAIMPNSIVMTVNGKVINYKFWYNDNNQVVHINRESEDSDAGYDTKFTYNDDGSLESIDYEGRNMYGNVVDILKTESIQSDGRSNPFYEDINLRIYHLLSTQHTLIGTQNVTFLEDQNARQMQRMFTYDSFGRLEGYDEANNLNGWDLNLSYDFFYD